MIIIIISLTHVWAVNVSEQSYKLIWHNTRLQYWSRSDTQVIRSPKKLIWIWHTWP